MSFRRMKALAEGGAMPGGKSTGRKGANKFAAGITSIDDLTPDQLEAFKNAIILDMRDLVIDDISRANRTFELLASVKKSGRGASIDFRSTACNLIDHQNREAWGIEGDPVELHVKKPMDALVEVGAVSKVSLADAKPFIEQVKKGAIQPPTKYNSWKQLRSLLANPKVPTASMDGGKLELAPEEGEIKGNDVYVYHGRSLWKALVDGGKLKGNDAKLPVCTSTSWIESVYDTIAAVEKPDGNVRGLAADWFFYATQLYFGPEEIEQLGDSGSVQSRYDAIRRKVLSTMKHLQVFWPSPSSNYHETLLTHMTVPTSAWWPWGRPPMYALRKFGLTSKNKEIVKETQTIINSLLAFESEQSKKKPTVEEELHSAISGYDEARVEKLIKKGAKINGNPPTPAGTAMDAALYHAVKEDRENLIKLLIKSGSDVNASKSVKGGYTPLHAAAAFTGNVDIIELLLSKGADINALDADGATPLMMACYEGQSDSVTLLLAKKAKADVKEQAGENALHYAAAAGQTKILINIQKAGKLSVTEPNKDGDTPLHLAAAGGHSQTCAKLISLGADSKAKNKAGKTAADLTDNKQLKRILSKGGSTSGRRSSRSNK